MKVEIKYPKAKCQYCGKTYTKHHNRQMYCSDECRTNAKKEQDTKARLRWVNKNKDRLYQTQLGTRTIGPHKHTDEQREQEIVQNEKRRLGLTMF
jgi:predicted nucleic acid-binding Zn ribbon protein